MSLHKPTKLCSHNSRPVSITTLGKRSSSTKKRTSNPNLVPEHIRKTFETELSELIEGLEGHGFKGDYLKSEYKSKYLDPTVVSPDDRYRNAVKKWQDQEAVNCVTNQRLQLGDEDFGWVTSDELIFKAREVLSTLLGHLDYPSLLWGGSHTTGASTRVRRGPSAAIIKHTEEAHVSSDCIKHWLSFASETRLSRQVLTVQEDSVLFTVPKKTDIDRVACKEPEINMLLQRSVGSHIRKRLRHVGIDLNNQEINRNLARQAVRLKLATIDLSSASDSITRQLVMELLPFDWYSLLDDLRVKTTIIDGEVHELEMFSSMGNGFTFELESAIFWALARSVAYYSNIRGRISVYGDDIIVPCTMAPRLARVFSWFGFRVNTKKSSWKGPFRESCGGHYYNGLDVSPFYLREAVPHRMDMIRLLNSLMEWDSRGVGFITDPKILSFHIKWSASIPRALHGGQDPEDPTCLVTGDPPRKRIVPRTKSVRVSGDPWLDCWLTMRESNGELPLVLKPRKEIGFKMIDHPAWTVRTTWDPWFARDL